MGAQGQDGYVANVKLAVVLCFLLTSMISTGLFMCWGC